MPARILIADDAKLVRVALRELLRTEAACDIVEAENGAEAVTKAVETKPDLVIMDVAMPSMDGLSATKEITKVLPDVPILMYSLYCSAELEVQARKVGAWKIVSKSESEALLGAIRDLLGGPQMDDRLAS